MEIIAPLTIIGYFGFFILKLFTTYEFRETIVEEMDGLLKKPKLISTKSKIKIPVKRVSTPQRCALCHGDGWDFVCKCRTTYHLECWHDLPKCAILACNISPTSLKEKTATLAYAFWKQEGCPNGREKEHWIRAERQILHS